MTFKNKFLLLLALALVSLTDSQGQDKVYYSSFRPQGWDIYLSHDHGKNFSVFTQNESLDYDAKISPDGNWVVFTSERNGRPQLYIKSVAGISIPRLLIQSNSMQDQVDFSPDGNWLVFVSTHGGNADIYKLPFQPADTLSVTDAINLTNDPGGDFRPRFSHDGQSIAFSSDRAHETKPLPRFVFTMQRTGDIYVMNTDGSETKRLTSSEDWEGSPTWTKDDQHLIYYSANRDAPFKLHKMTRQGENSTQISPESHSALSPLLVSDERILFTSRNDGTRGYSILELNTTTNNIDSSLVQPMDMFNIDYHNSGLMVYHGGKRPEPTSTNLNDFTGDLLVKNSPQRVNDLPDTELSLYGIRRSFAAPATPDGKIIYGVSDVNNFQEASTPFAYPAVLLPLLAIFWLLFGIYKSIKQRKSIAFWKHLIFSVLAVVIVLFIGKNTDDLMFFNVMRLSIIKSYLLVAAAVLLTLGLGAYFLYSKRKQAQNPIASLYKLYAFMLIPYAIIICYAGLMLSSFFNTEKDFYAVDYASNKIEHLFNFRPDPDFNPQFSNIIDTKITPDGQYLQFSVGGFRRSANAVGGVYRYHFKDKQIELMTDLNSNNGFADFSEDNKVMVFRSGRTGNMDIYVKENDAIVNITNSPDKETFPVISYDGNKIAYSSDVTGVDKDSIVKTMDIFLRVRENNGWSEPKQLTTYAGQEGHAHFSPDGEWLIYSSEEFGINDEQPLVQPYIFSPQMYGEITALRLSDGKKVRLTHNKWEDGAPLWLKGD